MKSSIVDVRLGSKYTSEISFEILNMHGIVNAITLQFSYYIRHRVGGS